MDFSEIRRKAKAQAAAKEAAKAAEESRKPEPRPERAASPAPGGAEEPGEPAEGVPGAAGTDADALERELSDRLLGLPPADERFTTWRPGSGVPPRVEEPPPRVAPVPREEDFTVVAGLGGGLGALPPPGSPPREERRARSSPDSLAEFFYGPDEEAPEIPAVGTPGEPAAPERDRESAAREEYLTFLIGSEEYAVAIERVREVMKSPPITEVPHAPPHVLGVVTVRGEVVAVFDPRRRLGLPGAAPPEGQGRVVIVDAGEGPCGLLVDAVASVVRLRPGTIEPRPQGIGGASAECLAGIGRAGDRLFTVLDLGAFLRRLPAVRRGDEEDRHAGP